MRRMVVYILSFSAVLLLVAGCGGRNRPKHSPVLVASESDYFFDTKVNTSEDLVELLKPAKGAASEFEVEPEMLLPDWRWDNKYLTRNPRWPESGDDSKKADVIEKAKAAYEKALEVHKNKLRNDDLKAVGKLYHTYATSVKPERTQQTLDNWKQYLRRQGKEGVGLRKKLESNAFEMAGICDVTQPGQIVAYFKEAEKDGKNLTIVTGKDPNEPYQLSGIKSDTVKDKLDEQFMANLSTAYLSYGADAAKRGANADVDGFKDFIKQTYYPILAESIKDNSIIILDFTQPKALYAALAPKLTNAKGALVLMKSGATTRLKENIIEKLIPPPKTPDAPP